MKPVKLNKTKLVGNLAKIAQVLGCNQPNRHWKYGNAFFSNNFGTQYFLKLLLILTKNIVEKRRKCSLGAIAALFHNIFNISPT